LDQNEPLPAVAGDWISLRIRAVWKLESSRPR